jgi:L-serine dehydratase
MAYSSYSELCRAARDAGQTLAQCVAARETADVDSSVEDIRAQMYRALTVMRDSVNRGTAPDAPHSVSGLVGGDAHKLIVVAEGGTAISPLFARLLGASLATAELNATMGRIVAAPTAGASGVLPGVLLSIAQERGLTDEALVDALLVAGALGAIFAAKATLAGAAGGCQAEIGTAAAMTAGALAYLLGGNPDTVGHAASLAMQGQLGLVCDPVAGRVEVPCVMRNATGAAVALAGAELALAGVTFPIPFDEVVGAAASVGKQIPPALRETAKGGLARTPTGKTL